jgi:hypothetical protein
MLTRFLDMLGVDSQDDLVSEIDPTPRDGSVTNTESSVGPRPPIPPRPPGPNGGGSGSNSDDSDDDPPVPPVVPEVPDIPEETPQGSVHSTTPSGTPGGTPQSTPVNTPPGTPRPGSPDLDAQGADAIPGTPPYMRDVVVGDPLPVVQPELTGAIRKRLVRVEPAIDPAVTARKAAMTARDARANRRSLEIAPEERPREARKTLRIRPKEAPVAGPRSHIDKLVDNLRVNPDTKDKLRSFYKSQEDVTAMSVVARSYHQRVKELEQLARNPNVKVRRSAEIELREVMDQIKVDMARAELGQNQEDEPGAGANPWVEDEDILDERNKGSNDTDSDNESLGVLTHQEGESVAEHSGEWWEDMNLKDLKNVQIPTTPVASQEINIRLPGVQVNIRPSIAGNRGSLELPTGASERTHTGMRPQDMRKWLEQAEDEKPPARTTITRSGRKSENPNRYSDRQEEKREREEKELAKAMELSKLENLKVAIQETSQSLKGSKKRGSVTSASVKSHAQTARNSTGQPAKSVPTKDTASAKSKSSKK